MRAKRIEFRPPVEGIVPEGLTAGEEFDLVTTYRLKGDGDLCITAIGDQKMPGYDKDSPSSDSKPTYTDYSQSMMNEGG